MPMMTSQILKSVDFRKTQKSRYLENESLFFLQIRKFIYYTSRATLWKKNSFVAEVTFKFNRVNAMLFKVRVLLNVKILKAIYYHSWNLPSPLIKGG